MIHYLIPFAFLVTITLSNHYWSNYHWSRQPPFTVEIQNCHTTSSKGVNWTPLFEEIVNNWNYIPSNQNGDGPLQSPNGIGFVANSNCEGSSYGVVRSYNGDYGKNGWLGLATISINTDDNSITRGESKINEYYIGVSSRFDNIIAYKQVLCQEIGHTFGLGHQSESGADLNTCMDYDYNLGNPYPNAHDLELLNNIYPYSVGVPTPTASTSTTSTSTTTTTTRKPKGKGKNKRRGLISDNALNNPNVPDKVKDKFAEQFGENIGHHTYRRHENGYDIITHITVAYVDDEQDYEDEQE